MDAENTAKYKSKKFALRIVNLYKYMCDDKREFIMSKQILKSGTSIGANLAEAECAETKYWLELFFESEYLTESEYISLNSDCEELRKMLSSTTKTMSSTLNSSNSKLQVGKVL